VLGHLLILPKIFLSPDPNHSHKLNMRTLVTDREHLLELAERTLEALHSERFSTVLTESVPSSALEEERTKRDTVVSALSSALDWARLEKQASGDQSYAEMPGTREPYIPSNQALSLLQSAYEEYLETRRDITEVPFDKMDPGWAGIALEKLKALTRGKHPFIKHSDPSNFQYELPENATLAIFSDWGTGQPTAIRVMQQIKALNPAYAIHLGDVYYSGTPKEVTERFLDVIEKYGPPILDPSSPAGSGCRYFSLNGNHDMYSGGYGYFDSILPRFGQTASYFNLFNQYWQLIGLDSGYEDFGLMDPQRDWLAIQLQQPTRKSILMSHHQLFSPYEDRAQNRTLARKVKPLLPRVYAWFWGHEHRCIIMRDLWGIKPRCVGHGAIPTPVPFGVPKYADIPIDKVDERSAPPPDGGEIHGFALLRFAGKQIDVSYIDEFGATFYNEKFVA
jgi:hypothetical protein